MERWVEISFDCLPLRTVGRLDVPLDATPEFRAQCERVRSAVDKHGAHNTYYVYDASCVFHLTNDPKRGMLEFSFEGTVLTDAEDRKTLACDLAVALARETCDWITQPVVEWFAETVSEAVKAEFDQYIASGDLKRTVERLEKLESLSDQQGGFIGLGL